jgi:hypothetical protein
MTSLSAAEAAFAVRPRLVRGTAAIHRVRRIFPCYPLITSMVPVGEMQQTPAAQGFRAFLTRSGFFASLFFTPTAEENLWARFRIPAPLVARSAPQASNGGVMTGTAMRFAIGLLGALAIALAIRFWIDPVGAGAALGVAGNGLLGLATLRADFGSFFAVAAILLLAGAITNDAGFLTAPLLLFAAALLGRVLTIALNGYSPSELQPMIVEAVLVVLIGLGRRSLGAR